MTFEVVIGLETHTQLSCVSKIFSGASTAFGAAPNTQACAIDVALPGTLPVINRAAVERAMACGMGTCQSCCIRVRKTDPAKPPLPGKDWCYRLACTDGPIFTAAQLLW